MRLSLVLPFALALLAKFASAGGPETGSLLVFPEFDNRTGHRTYLTITNTDSSRTIRVHLNLVNASNCLVSNRTVTLTPRDTYTALTSALAASGQRGYVWAYAQSTTTGRAIDFDWLAGSSLRVDAAEATDYSIPPFVYRGLTSDGQNTDADNDFKPDLDGVEYERSPHRICVPRFFGQTSTATTNTFVSDLVLFQPLAPAGVTTTVGFLVFNDNEQVFSAQRTFTCWSRQRLLAISGLFADSFLKSTGHTAAEVVGQTAMEAGWFEVDGIVATGPGAQSQGNPPILGVLIDLRPNSGADLPFLVR
ncbi:MAG: hypothetical protein IPJ77_23545 [Planctomycetes bacterium]|nr:hypothetical protein [Planctomycetota bacterium]